VFDTTNYRKHFEAARTAADIEFFRWHDARQTFATWLGQSGAHWKASGTSSALQRRRRAKYRHVVDGELRAALDRLPAVTAAQRQSRA
jgi:hypothetical protein